MLRLASLRSPVAFATIGVLALLLRTPLCAPEVCSMDQAAMAAACSRLGSDCCHPTGQTHAPVQVPPPAPLPSIVSAAVAAGPAPVHGCPEPSAAPAILQGVGLHTLLAVFLI